jgi:hypothetical protein
MVMGPPRSALVRRAVEPHLDEFAFRSNLLRMPLAAFQALLGLGTQQPPPTYKPLYSVGSTA